MIAEEIFQKTLPCELSESQGKTLECIKECIIKAIIPFKKAKLQRNINVRLNEKKMTQIFVEQVGFQLIPFSSIAVNCEYSDLFFGTKGISDFYFYNQEEGKTNLPLFVVEAKRLPAPNNKKVREKEYVVGCKDNGGVERYKKEIHGKQLDECGMIGFIEKYSQTYWLNIINKWIKDLAENECEWEDDELLTIKESEIDFAYLLSIAHRKISNKDVLLHHWWIIG